MYHNMSHKWIINKINPYNPNNNNKTVAFHLHHPYQEDKEPHLHHRHPHRQDLGVLRRLLRHRLCLLILI